MKQNLVIGISCMLAAFVTLYACQKQLTPSAVRTSLTASTTNAATGEKVTLSVVNAPAATHLVWTSTPAGYTLFGANGQGSATVSFNKPGTYTITCYVVSGEGEDSIPNSDTSTHNPYDTIPNYPPPPPPPPYDSTNYPHDTTPSYPHDTIPGYPDTTQQYPHDTTPNYPHDTTPSYPHDTITNYPPPYDSSYYPRDSTIIDSLAHLHNNHIVTVVTITIVVR